MTITVSGDDSGAKRADKNCAPFTDCISNMSNTQTDNARDIDAVMSMYNFTEYIGNYSKTSGSLWQYCRNEPSDQVVNSNSFKSKIKMTEKTTAAVI